MTRFRRAALGAAAAAAASWTMVPVAQRAQLPLPLDPPRERGASVTPAYEGWYSNRDGSFTMLIGYYNRNRKETLDIPIGANNRIEPGDPDQGQPTHFEAGREWGVFAIRVPKDFGSKALTWTLTANGETQSIPFTLNKAYAISPFKDVVMGNAPPVLAFSRGGARFTGPPLSIAASLSGRVNQPVTLTVWVEDPKGSGQEGGANRGGEAWITTVSLHKFRGPGGVIFDKDLLPVAQQGGMVSTTAIFSAPGAYTLRVQANDESGEGGGGFQCCWTNAHVMVTVK